MNIINKWIKFCCFLSMSLILVALMGCTPTETLSPSTSVPNSTFSTSISTTNPSTSQVSTSTSSITPVTTSTTQSTTPPTTNIIQSLTTTQNITSTTASSVSTTTPVQTSTTQSTTPTTNSPVSTTTTTDGTATPNPPLMQFTSAQLAELDAAYGNASMSSVRPQEAGVPLPQSVNLLPDLDYNPGDRNQGSSPNCWVWAGTGIMEIALDVEKSIKDRLSVQYFDSNYNGGIIEPGSISSFATFYATHGIAIPWSNSNANYRDGSGPTKANVPASSIGTIPNYPVNPGIADVRLFSPGVSQATAESAVV